MKNLVILAVLLTQGCVCTTIEPGNRGVEVTFGEVTPRLFGEGLQSKNLFGNVTEISVRQQTQGVNMQVFSSDLQEVSIHAKVMYRIPEDKVITIFRDYAGDPFQTLVVPRVNEALKEITADKTAEQLAKGREDVKMAAFELTKKKVGDVIVIEDFVIENVNLSNQLQAAIEAKMVMEQEANKAKFVQQKAQIEADTAIIKAEGEAKAIKIRGDALRQSPEVINLTIAEKWDGKAPLVVGGGNGANVLLPLK